MEMRWNDNSGFQSSSGSCNCWDSNW